MILIIGEAYLRMFFKLPTFNFWFVSFGTKIGQLKKQTLVCSISDANVVMICRHYYYNLHLSESKPLIRELEF